MPSIVSRAILKSTRLAPSTARPIGMPFASVSKLRLVPRLPRTVGLGPVFFPTERRLGHRTVHRLPAPVDADELIICLQRFHPRVPKDSRLDPLEEAPVCRRTRADARSVQ